MYLGRFIWHQNHMKGVNWRYIVILWCLMMILVKFHPLLFKMGKSFQFYQLVCLLENICFVLELTLNFLNWTIILEIWNDFFQLFTLRSWLDFEAYYNWWWHSLYTYLWEIAYLSCHLYQHLQTRTFMNCLRYQSHHIILNKSYLTH